MTEAEIHEAAQAEANSRAPAPMREPIQAGLSGAAIAGIVVLLFCTAAGLNTDDFAVAVSITVAAAFLAPYGWLTYQRRQHSKAYAAAYMRLRNEARKTVSTGD